MASEIKVDTVSEKTSGSGVTIDGVLIKDGGITGDIQLSGTTPSLTIGDAGAEDAKLVFDGNAQDFYIALDDSADDLLIGKGSAVGTTPAVAIDENLQVKIVATTASTSATTGSFIAAGGAGVAADLHVGDDVTLISDSAVLGFGADKDTTLTHTDGTGLTLNSTNKLCFNDATQYIQGASGTVLDIAATDEIELTATLLDVNANLDVSGTTLLPTAGIITAKDLGVGLHIRVNDTGGSVHGDADALVIEDTGHMGMTFLTANSKESRINFGDGDAERQGGIGYDHPTDAFYFYADEDKLTIKAAGGAVTINENSIDMDFRVESNANAHNIFSDGGNNRLIFMKSTNAIGTAGTTIENDGEVIIARAGNVPLNINRAGDGGVIVNLSQAGTVRGTISESGGTVSYNAFCGSHWSRLTDNSKPTILRGTVMESIATLLTWYQVEFSVPILDENGANVIDENGDNVVSVERKSITLPEGKSVGDTITHTWPSDGKDYSAKIIQEENERLPMCKISNTADSKSVYGVFMGWDNDDDTVNDMYVAGIGAFVVRIHKDETVAIGNWLVSKGDGTAKVLAGNTAITADVQSSIIGKVTSTTKTHTHADDSYCVPCTLHCG